MVTAHELSVNILDIVNKSFFSFNDAVVALDEGVGAISFAVLLPYLETSSEVVTVDGLNICSLPADYQRNLHFCYSNTQNLPVRVFDTKTDLTRYYGNSATAGPVKGVTIHGTNLYYQRIPALADIETLKIDYYKVPDTVSARTDTFPLLPAHLTKQLLVNYGCLKLFEKVEQGDNDRKQNTLYHSTLFTNALIELKKAFPVERFRG